MKIYTTLLYRMSLKNTTKTSEKEMGNNLQLGVRYFSQTIYLHIKISRR